MLNIGLLHFPLLFYTSILVYCLPEKPISHQLSQRECFYLLVVVIGAYPGFPRGKGGGGFQLSPAIKYEREEGSTVQLAQVLLVVSRLLFIQCKRHCYTVLYNMCIID